MDFFKSLQSLFQSSPGNYLEKQFSTLKKITTNPNANWQEQYDIEQDVYGEAVLLDKHLWYAKHPKFIRILMAEGIIKRTTPRSDYYILLKHEALIYFIWQEFFSNEKAENFFSIFIDINGKHIDKKRINTIRQNQDKYLSKHSPSAKLTESLYKILND